MSDVKKCPHCGKLIHSQAQYCMFCMTSLQSKQDITTDVDKSKKWITTAILLLAVVIVMFVLVVFAIIMKNHFEADAPGSESTIPHDESQVPGLHDQTTCETEESIQATSDTEESTAPIPTVSESNVEKPVIHIPRETNSKTDGSQVSSGKNEPQATTPTEKPTVEQPVNPTQSNPVPETEATQAQICNHSYTAANCVMPMTCKTCGNTVGTADMSAHKWKPVTAVVHHEEVGHYENVEVSYKKTVYLCFFCGYNQDGYDTMDDLRAHMGVHSNKLDYNYVMSCPDLLADTREVWATKTENQWVVDKEAYDETVITGYVCTVCNKQKDP